MDIYNVCKYENISLDLLTLHMFDIPTITRCTQPIIHILFVYITDDMRKVLKQCNSKYIITVPSLLAKVETVLKDFSHIKVITDKNNYKCTNKVSPL